MPKKILVVASLCIMVSSASLMADSWPNPGSRVFTSSSGVRAFKVVPQHAKQQAMATLYFLNDDATEKVIWQGELVNIPHRALVCDGPEECVVTLDTWAALGQEHSVVIYGPNGGIIADYKLEDLLTPEEIKDHVQQSLSSRPWTMGADIRVDGGRQLVIGLNWGKTINIELKTGKIEPQAPTTRPAGANEKINTPVVTATLEGAWELQTDAAGAFKETLDLDPGLTGQWHQSKPSLPMTIVWFVEGNELRIQHYSDPEGTFDWHVKTLMVGYKLSGDTLNLTFEGKPTTWHRVKATTPTTRVENNLRAADVAMIAEWLTGSDQVEPFEKPFGDSKYLSAASNTVFYTDIDGAKLPQLLHPVTYEFLQARLRIVKGGGKVDPAVLITRAVAEKSSDGGLQQAELRVRKVRDGERLYYVEVAIGNMAWHRMKIAVYDVKGERRVEIIWRAAS